MAYLKIVNRAAAAAYRDQQAGLKALFLQDANAAWARLDPGHLPGTLDDYAGLIREVTTTYGSGWAELGARYYEQRRSAAHILGRYRPVLAPRIPADQVHQTVLYATRNLWDDPQDPTAQRVASQLFERLARNQGRDTVTANATKDRASRGWARVAEAGACDFCLMLETRGAVYRSAETAGEGGTYHRDCACEVVPVFDGETYSPDDSGD